jgi:syntaxin-binding protein 1
VKEPAATATLGAGGASAPGPVSLRSKPQWTKSGRPAAANETRQRVLVFVAGGMTYSEMRTAYDLSKQLGKDVFIGVLSFLKVLLIV